MMEKRVKTTKIEIIALMCLLISGTATLYYKFGGILLIFSLVLLIVEKCKKCVSTNEKFIIGFVVALPFYTLVRALIVHFGVPVIGGIYNYIRDIIVILLLFKCILSSNGRIRMASTDRVFGFFIIVWIWGILVSFISGYGMVGIKGLHLTVIPALLYIIILNSEISEDEDIISKTFIQIAFIIAIIGLVAYYSRPLYFKELFYAVGNEGDASDYVRFVSVFFTPNVCGNFLSTGFAICLAKLISEKSSKIYLIPLLVFGYCVLLTLSRGSWAYLVGVIVVALIIIKPQKGIIVGIVIFIGYILFSSTIDSWLDTFMGNIIQKRFYSLFDTNNNSSYGRVNSWKSAMDLLHKSPFGFGMGVASTAVMNTDLNIGVSVIDGFYIKTIIETGILGVLFCIMFVVWTLISNVINVIKTKKSEISITALLICTGFLLQSFGSNTFDFVCVAPWFWVYLGYAVKIREKRNYNETNTNPISKS